MSRLLSLLTLVALLAFPAGAFAASVSPVDDQYGNPVEGASQPPAQASSGTVAGLPFTGVELGMIVAAGGLALTGGAALRLIARRDDRRRDQAR